MILLDRPPLPRCTPAQRCLPCRQLAASTHPDYRRTWTWIARNRHLQHGHTPRRDQGHPPMTSQSVDAEPHYRRIARLWEAIEPDTALTGPDPHLRWLTALAPVGSGALHVAHPDTGESLCGKPHNGRARTGDARHRCAYCGWLADLLSTHEAGARSYRQRGWPNAPVPPQYRTQNGDR